jgi:hypothetical protein
VQARSTFAATGAATPASLLIICWMNVFSHIYAPYTYDGI